MPRSMLHPYLDVQLRFPSTSQRRDRRHIVHPTTMGAVDAVLGASRLILVVALVAMGAGVGAAGAVTGDAVIADMPEIPTYVVHRTDTPIVIDGRLDDAAWLAAPRTGAWRWLDTHQEGRLATYGQMAWDDEFFYFAFSAEDPDIWATMLVRDAPVYIEEDFEIFLDPDGDEFNYYEWQINPLGTIYDVIWNRPGQTPGSGSRGIHGFDLTPMLTGFQVSGTVWQRDDVDSGWTAEVALSWEGLARIPGRFRSPPQPGDTWRIGFSRVEAPKPPYWQADWTWPTHGEYNMHIGQRDGYVQFTDAALGSQLASFKPVPRLYNAEVRIEPAGPGGGMQPGQLITLVPRIGNDGAPARQVEARLSSPDSLVTVLDSVALVGSVAPGRSTWAEDGFVVRLSRTAQPGRSLLFQLALSEGDGRWSGDYFFAFAAGRRWHTAFQLHEGVQALLADDDGIWGISRSNIWHWDGDGQVLGFYQPDDGLPRHARVLARDGAGRIWTAGARGIAYFDTRGWHELTGRQGLPPGGFERLAVGPDGAMWIAARQGLYRFDTDVEAVWVAADGYHPGTVRDLLVDRRGAAWVVGDSLVYRAGSEGLQVLGMAAGLPSNHLTAIGEDPDGNVWLAAVPTSGAHHDGGVGRFDGVSWKVWRRADGLAQNEVTSLFADHEGRIWTGHPDGGLSVYDGQTWDHWAAVPAAPCSDCAPLSGPVRRGPGAFLQDEAGRIWIAGRQGLAQYDGAVWRHWTWRNGLLSGPVQAIAQGPGGRVYVGDGRSLSYYRD